MQHALVEYLVNAAWQVPLIVAGALVVSRLAGLTPTGRNLAWLGFLALAVVAPALPAYRPLTDYRPPAAVTAAPALAGSPSEAATVNLDRASPLHLLRLELRPRSAALIKLAFVTVAAIGVARLTLSALAARRLVRRSSEAVLALPVVATLQAFSQAHDGVIPPIRTCSELSCPVVVGAMSPVILIPDGFTALAEGDQQAALLHEFAHVVRRDYAVNLLSELAALPLSWHPAVYPLKAGIRRSRELACDAMAAASMASEKVYARRLLSLAKSMGASAPTPALVGLFGKSDLEDRLTYLLASKGVEPRGLRAARLGGAAAVTVLALAPAVLFRVTPALAEVQPPTAVAAHPAAPAASPVPPAPPIEPPLVRVHTRARNCPPARRSERARAAAQATLARSPSPAEQPARQLAGGLISPDSQHIATRAGDSAARVADMSRDQQRQAAAAARLAERQADAAQRMADLAQRRADLVARATERMQQRVDEEVARNDARVQEALVRAQAQIDAAAERQSSALAERIQRQVERSVRAATRSAD
jgi:beta-lactamase regulating signal transducer with metallopeptidase domain